MLRPYRSRWLRLLRGRLLLSNCLTRNGLLSNCLTRNGLLSSRLIRNRLLSSRLLRIRIRGFPVFRGPCTE